MDRIPRIRVLRLALMLLLPLPGLATEAPMTDADVVSGVWQHRTVTLSYFGITSSYSCDALEDRVRNILLLLGARKDAKVDASCPRGPNEPSRTAWIRTDFYALAPADATSGADAVKAYWAPRAVTPHKPYFMGDGDCELIEQMKDLISNNLSLRDVQYRTECIAHEIVVGGFSITGQALIPVPKAGNVKG